MAGLALSWGVAAAAVSWLAADTGQLSLGHSGFMAVGGYGFALAISSGVAWPLAIVIAIAAAGLAGAAVSWLGGSAKGALFSLLTLGFGLAVPRLALLLSQWTGGSQGLAVKPLSGAGGWPDSDLERLAVAAVVSAALCLAAAGWQRGWLGASWRLQRDRPDVATSYGLSPRRLRLLAVGLSAAMTGGAGALVALLTGLVSPYDYGLIAAFQLVVAAAAGRLGSIIGAMFAAGVLTVVPFAASAVTVGLRPEWLVVSQGALLLIAVRLWPQLRARWAAAMEGSVAAAAGGETAAEGGAAGVAGGGTATEGGAAAAGSGDTATEDAVTGQGPPTAGPSPFWLKAAGVRGQPGVLAVQGLAVSRSTFSLQPASFKLTAGSVTVLRGDNGSGKSTLLAALSGHLAVAGSRRLIDHELHGLPPSAAAARGLARTWQGAGLAPGLTVGEQLALAALADWPLWRAAVPGMSGRLWRRELRTLSRLGGPVAGLADRPTQSLSGGQAAFIQLLAASRRRPAVLLLDEPFAGMGHAYRPWVEAMIDRLRADGTAVFAVEHRRGWLDGADEWRLRDGQLVPGGTEMVPAGPKAALPVAAHVGPAEAEAAPRAEGVPPTAVAVGPAAAPAAGQFNRHRRAALAATGLRFGHGTGPDLSPPISLTLYEGTVTGLLGSNGSGKSTLLRVLAGLRARGGEVTVGGTVVADGHARQRHGVALVPQHGSVFPDLTVAEQLRLAAVAARHRDGSGIERACALLPPVVRWLHQPARHLSGGQQQLVALARAIAMQPNVLLLDEPTAGLDADAQQLVADALRELAGGGTAIFVAEQNERWLAEIAAEQYTMTPGGLVKCNDQAAIVDRSSSMVECCEGVEP